MRITKKEVYGMFRRFLSVIGEREAQKFNDTGGFNLDHNATYGGYMIEKIGCDRGSVDHPFCSKRMNASEMYNALYFATCAFEFKQYKERE